MNIHDYITAGGFVKADTVSRGPIRDVISDCKPGRYDRPDLYLQGGGVLGLNTTNMRTLSRAWGEESDDWIGKEVELYLGTTTYQGEARNSVLVRPISPPTPWKSKPPESAKPATSAKGQQDFDDSIPF